MQQHPVPQNVINFQFKLVGDMTLKQFGYLAGGIITAIVASKLPYPAIFNYSLAGIFAFSGFALAFLPIEDRPLDIWVKNFIISIFSPTQFVYKKTGGTLDFLNIDLSRSSQNATLVIEKNLKQDRYRDYLETLTQQKKNPIDLVVNNYLKSLDIGNVQTQAFGVQSQLPKTETNKNILEEDVKVRPLSQFQTIKLDSLSHQSTVYKKDTYFAPEQQIKPRKTNFDYLLNKVQQKQEDTDSSLSQSQKEATQKENLAKQLEEIEKKQTVQDVKNTRTMSDTIDVSQVTKILKTPQTPKTPNIISGTVATKTGEAISGAIVEIVNNQGIAARTLKTNSIGQFATVTPLFSGEYTVFIEKEGFTFDNIKIVLDNKIVEPLLIKAH